VNAWPFITVESLRAKQDPYNSGVCVEAPDFIDGAINTVPSGGTDGFAD
jgi:hypothetical protein